MHRGTKNFFCGRPGLLGAAQNSSAGGLGIDRGSPVEKTKNTKKPRAGLPNPLQRGDPPRKGKGAETGHHSSVGFSIIGRQNSLRKVKKRK